MIRLFVNSYTDPDPARNAELVGCLRRNEGNPLIGAIHHLKGRATFTGFFAAINEVAEPDDIGIIANADIYFDETLELALKLKSDEAYALTRWEGGRIFCDENRTPRCDSQDCWMFRGLIGNVQADFPLGMRGCDNAITARLAKAGYRVLNPSQWIRCLHLHKTQIRRYGHEQKDMVAKPYLLIDPHTLDEQPKYRWCL